MLAAGDTSDSEPLEPPSGDFHAGLVGLGMAYAELLSRPRMADLIRAVIAESARFPELRQRTFDFGTLPVLRALRRYFQTANAQGIAHVNDPDVAAAQFLGMIATVVFWPRLVHGNWSLTDEETLHTVDEAARTIVARYATTQSATDVRAIGPAMGELPEHVAVNREYWDGMAHEWVEGGERAWKQAEPTWGQWGIPEGELHLLPDDMTGLRAIELGCGTAYVSAWMTRRGASVTAIDNSAEQLRTAQRLSEQHGVALELIHGNAEAVPIPATPSTSRSANTEPPFGPTRTSGYPKPTGFCGREGRWCSWGITFS